MQGAWIGPRQNRVLPMVNTLRVRIRENFVQRNKTALTAPALGRNALREGNFENKICFAYRWVNTTVWRQE
jgi:hypothetical protein